MAVTSSRSEDARDAIIAELKNISTANGYRTSPIQVIQVIRPIEKVRRFPEIGVELADEDVDPKDSNRAVFDSYVQVHIAGLCEATTGIDDDETNLVAASEALLHDIKRIVGSLTLQWANRSPNKWHIPKDRGPIRFYRLLGIGGEKRNKAQVGASFTIQIWKQDEQFADPTSTQVGDLALEGGGDILLESNQNILTEGAV